MRSPLELRGAVTEFMVTTAALRAGLIDAVIERPYDVRSLARVTGLDRRAVGRMVDALKHFGVVQEIPGLGFALTDEARRAYRPVDGTAHYRSLLMVDTTKSLMHLPEVLRTGEPVADKGPDPVRLRNWIYAQTERPPEVLERAAAMFVNGLPEGAKILDLAGGPGHMSRLFIDAGHTVTLFDLPEVIELVGPDLGGTNHLRLVAGDLRQGLPEGERYDAVYMGNINNLLTAEENAELFKRLGGHLVDGGRVGIQTHLGDHSSYAPVNALQLMVFTPGGDAWPLEKYEHWLDTGGFAQVEAHDLDEEQVHQLVCAQKV